MHALLIPLCRPSLLQLGFAPTAEHEGLGISGLSSSCILSCGGVGFAAGLILRLLPGSFFDFFLFLLRCCVADSHSDSRKKEFEGCGIGSATVLRAGLAVVSENESSAMLRSTASTACMVCSVRSRCQLA